MSPAGRFLSRVLLFALALGAGCLIYAVVFGDSLGAVLFLFVYLASTPLIAFWAAERLSDK